MPSQNMHNLLAVISNINHGNKITIYYKIVIE